MAITEPQIEARRMRGQAIAQLTGQIKKDRDWYQVRSQSGASVYKVTQIAEGWYCSCPDFTIRGVVACKHIFAVQFSRNFRETVKVEREKKPVVIEQFNATSCLFCQSPNLEKFGVRHNLSGDIQRFRCRSCSRTFSVNIGFEKMKHNPKAITAAMQLYFNGESLRNTAESLKLLGVQVSYQTIFKWIRKYTRLMEKYIQKPQPNVSGTWRADELFVKFRGNMKYVFAMMDDETRYWIAQEVGQTKETHDARGLFEQAQQVAGKKPEVLITDGLKAYHTAYNDLWYTHRLETRTRHIRQIRMAGKIHNNKMERLNGEIRDREKVMRGLKTENTPILKGYQIYHNYLRPHEGLNGKTPAEACGIQVEGENKWVTLIQNASLEGINRKVTTK